MAKARLEVDLRGSTDPTLGPAWLSVTSLLDFDHLEWSDRIREAAADYYQVPLRQVGEVKWLRLEEEKLRRAFRRFNERVADGSGDPEDEFIALVYDEYGIE